MSPQDRLSAKSLLENQRSVLRERVKSHVDAAYGLDPLVPGSLDTVHTMEPSERFVSLWPGFEPRPPVAANLGGAMIHLVSQALEHDYPAAPLFEAEIKSSHLKKVFEVTGVAAQASDDRAPVDKTLRPLIRAIANPLKLGEMGLDKTHFVIGQHWKNHFTRKIAEKGGAPDVRNLRRWMNEPKHMGLPKEAENLVILTYALQANLSFFLHGAAFEASLGNLPDLCILRAVDLPPPDLWKRAIDRAASIFGLAVSPHLSASNVASLVTQVKNKASEGRQHCQTFCQKLRERLSKLAIPDAESDRLKTATATMQLLEKLNQSADGAVVAALASARLLPANPRWASAGRVRKVWSRRSRGRTGRSSKRS